MSAVMAVISPAKKLDFKTPSPVDTETDGRFNQQAAELVDILRTYSVTGLRELMGLSDSLASLNVERFGQWQLPMPAGHRKQALFAFQGDVYQGLDAYNLGASELKKAQQQVRILSGLYGVLRPMDLILPYRLEMGTRLSNPRGPSLYDWWGELVSETLARDVREAGAKTLVNLASNEYFKVVDQSLLPVPVLTPEFRDLKNGQYKIISFYAKKARGLMVRYMVQNNVQTVDDLKAFNLGGYQFDAERSTDDRWLFLRDEASQDQ